jgi:hypothetical protein
LCNHGNLHSISSRSVDDRPDHIHVKSTPEANKKTRREKSGDNWRNSMHGDAVPAVDHCPLAKLPYVHTLLAAAQL